MGKGQVIHPLFVRIVHWLNVLATLVMVLSGWRIYDASPLFPFRFPEAITLGGWLAGALQWHFAAMWLLVLNGLLAVLYGIFSGHYRRHYLPITWHSISAALAEAIHGRLKHELGHYNALQRLAYIGVVIVALILVASGLAIWKPVQLQELASLFGGYEAARYWHFFAMSAIVVFVVIHVIMVIIVPRTLLPMLTGRVRRESGRLNENTP